MRYAVCGRCLIGKRKTVDSGCSAAPATVRTFAPFHCRKAGRKGAGTNGSIESVVSREICRTFKKPNFEGMRKNGKTPLLSRGESVFSAHLEIG